MGGLKQEVDAAEVGLDPARLGRIDRHFARYVDDGRLPGWLITVSRRGRLAHVSCYGPRDIEAGLAGGAGHAVADLLDDQAGHLGRRDDALRGGRVRAHRPGERLHPVVRRRPRVRRRTRTCGRSPCPATEPVRIWHLLTHTSGLTYGFHRVHPVDAMYRAAGFEWASPPGHGPGAGLRRLGRPPAAVPAGLGVELLGGHRRARPGGRGRLRAAPRTSSSRPGSCARWA